MIMYSFVFDEFDMLLRPYVRFTIRAGFCTSVHTCGTLTDGRQFTDSFPFWLFRLTTIILFFLFFVNPNNNYRYCIGLRRARAWRLLYRPLHKHSGHMLHLFTLLSTQNVFCLFSRNCISYFTSETSMVPLWKVGLLVTFCLTWTNKQSIANS